MSEHRDDEARSWDQESADGDRAVEEIKKSMDRLRGHVGAYRGRMSDSDNDNSDEGEGSPEA